MTSPIFSRVSYSPTPSEENRIYAFLVDDQTSEEIDEIDPYLPLTLKQMEEKAHSLILSSEISCLSSATCSEEMLKILRKVQHTYVIFTQAMGKKGFKTKDFNNRFLLTKINENISLLKRKIRKTIHEELTPYTLMQMEAYADYF